jgi:ABC-2 type transport system permease protein
LLRVQVLHELQYRANFWARLLNSVLALVTGLAVLGLVFDKVDRLGGWSAPELLAVMGVFTMINGLVQMVIIPSVELLLNDIREGGLDHVLLKPVDAQFMVGVRVVRLYQGVDVLVGAAVIVAAVWWLGRPVGPATAAGFALSLLFGAVIVYSFLMLVTTTAFWFIKLDTVVELFSGMYQAARWPVGIYPDWLRIGLTFLVPVGLAVTVPAEALTGRLTGGVLLGEGVLAMALAAAARAWWNAGLRRYSGASA